MRNSTKNNTTIPPAPTEDSWGFYGTIVWNSRTDENPDGSIHYNSKEAGRIWLAACRTAAKTFKVTDPDIIRNFLRAPVGRHLADEVYNLAESVNADALVKAVSKALNQNDRAGRNIWVEYFNEIKKATKNGTWQE